MQITYSNQTKNSILTIKRQFKEYPVQCQISLSKVHLTTGHAGPEGQYRYNSTLSLTSALDGGGCLTPSPRPLQSRAKTPYPFNRKLHGPHSLHGLVQKISPPGRIRSPDLPAHKQSLYQLCYPSPQIS